MMRWRCFFVVERESDDKWESQERLKYFPVMKLDLLPSCQRKKKQNPGIEDTVFDVDAARNILYFDLLSCMEFQNV